MLIFDEFPSEDAAREFMEQIRVQHGRDTWLFMSQEESDELDPFPCELTPPIVYVERHERPHTVAARQRDTQSEEKIVRLVEEFGGSFAGT